MNCSALKKNGEFCQINADRLVDGEWVCHIHDPGGLFRFQQGSRHASPSMNIQRQKLARRYRKARAVELQYRMDPDGSSWVRLPPWPVTITRTR